MATILPIDPKRVVLDINRDLTVTPRARQPGPPKRIDGVTVGFVSMARSAPHGGEIHPDGDEILYVISGRVRVECDSEPDNPLELKAGDACIVPAGEWHKVEVIEPTELVHMTPGPGGDHRPLRPLEPEPTTI